MVAAVGVFLGASFCAWLYAGSSEIDQCVTHLPVVWILSLILTVWWSLPGPETGWKLKRLGWGVFFPLYLAGLWLTMGYLNDRYATAVVHVENYSPMTLFLELDGAAWLDAAAGSSVSTTLRKGDHWLVVRSAEKELKQARLSVHGKGVYVLNLLEVGAYEQGRAYYDKRTLRLKNVEPEEQFTRPWFEVEVDFPFQYPPETIAPGKYSLAFIPKTYLRRLGPKKGERPPDRGPE